MFHHFFLVMTLSGSVVFLLYKLTDPITRRWMPPSWRKGLLYLSLFFYLVPVPLFRDRLFSKLGLSLPFPARIRVIEGIAQRIYQPQYVIDIWDDGHFTLGRGVVAVIVFAVCTVIIASIIMLRQLRRYRKTCRTYQQGAFCGPVPSSLGESLRKEKEEVRLKRPVKLVCSQLCDTPMTIGIFSPTIVFPAPGGMVLDEDDCRSVLKHELLHIKYRDLLIRFFALLALAIHWYNPVCYFLFRELRIVSELDCDYGVTKDYSDPQRRRYGELILDLATTGGGGKERFSVGLADNGTADFERRLLEMKKPRKKGKPLLACALIAVMGAAGLTTAFAYQSPTWVGAKDDGWTKYDEVYVVTSFGPRDAYPQEYFLYDEFFTDPDGNIFPLEVVPMNGSCAHTLLEGVATKHTESDDGSCTVREENCLFCDRCEYAIKKEVLNNAWYAVCIHTESDVYVEHLPFDDFFTDSNGIIIPLEGIPLDGSCRHTLLEGEAKSHTKNDDGSCTVGTENCLFCDRCRYAIKKGGLSEERFDICKH